MATYTLDGKNYELKISDSSTTIWPKISVDLVAEDGDEINVFYHDCDQDDGNPEATYAGGGRYYKGNQGETVTPDEAAEIEAAYTAQWALNRMTVPEKETGIWLRSQIEQAVQVLLRTAYYDLYSRTFKQYAANRMEEEADE